MDSLVLQTAIGLVFIFGITAAAVSAVTEGVSRFLGLRAEYLLRGVRTLVDGKSDFGLWRRRPEKTEPDKTEPARVAQIMNHPLVASSGDGGKTGGAGRQRQADECPAAGAAVIHRGPDIRQGPDRHPAAGPFPAGGRGHGGRQRGPGGAELTPISEGRGRGGGGRGCGG